MPAEVEAVVMKALAKDRDQRYQTMKEMSLALAGCSSGSAEEAWGDEPSSVLDAGARSRAEAAANVVAAANGGARGGGGAAGGG